MNKNRRKRRFLKWKKYRYQCEQVTGQTVPFTGGMGDAWIRAARRYRGKFMAMPPWKRDLDIPAGRWQYKDWMVDDERAEQEQ